jgi:hypothetical protein
MYPSNFDRQMPIVEPSYQSFIIKPPERNITFGRMPIRLLIDSCDRDTEKYPNPAQYTYMLNKEISEVVAIELSQACIPNTQYNINNTNNIIYFQESYDTILTAEIPIGQYNDLFSLRGVIQFALNNAVGRVSNYIVGQEPSKSLISIQSDLTGGDNIFKLIFKQCQCKRLCDDCECCIPCSENKPSEYMKRSAGMLMGFPKKNLQFATGTVSNFSETTVYGNCTLFTKELRIDDLITFDNQTPK